MCILITIFFSLMMNFINFVKFLSLSLFGHTAQKFQRHVGRS